MNGDFRRCNPTDVTNRYKRKADFYGSARAFLQIPMYLSANWHTAPVARMTLDSREFRMIGLKASLFQAARHKSKTDYNGARL
ncbi:MAG: hypothetical protein ABL888_08845 [Pirellulaceae bacterium]